MGVIGILLEFFLLQSLPLYVTGQGVTESRFRKRGLRPLHGAMPKNVGHDLKPPHPQILLVVRRGMKEWKERTCVYKGLLDKQARSPGSGVSAVSCPPGDKRPPEDSGRD